VRNPETCSVQKTEMTKQPKDSAGRIPLEPFLADYRSSMSDRELMAKYSLSAQAFVGLIKTLLAQKAITQQDITGRRAAAEQRELAKESEFLAGLYICPYCGHPHPSPFTVCPACGAEVRVPSSVKDVLTSMASSSGNHIVLQEESPPAAQQETEEDEEADVIEVDDLNESGEVEVETIPEEAAAPPSEPSPTKKRSAVESVRSFFSKAIKK
jgi:hypothetical protein